MSVLANKRMVGVTDRQEIIPVQESYDYDTWSVSGRGMNGRQPTRGDEGDTSANEASAEDEEKKACNTKDLNLQRSEKL